MYYLKSKTILFNMALAAFGVLEATNWIDVFGDTYAGLAAAVVGIIGVALRKATKVPLEAK